MGKFVMGDVHGAYKAMLQCFDRASFDYETDELIQLGDVVDGFDEVYECVEELMKLKNLICIKGNHDDWFSRFCETGYHEQHWSQGGKGTVSSYLKYSHKKPNFIASKLFGFNVNIEPPDVPALHKEFFARQALYHVDENNNCYVHAGFNRYQSFYDQREDTYYWDRSLIIDAIEFEQIKKKMPDIHFECVTTFNKIFVGHTSTIVWKIDTPIQAANVVNMDTGAGWGGKLTIMNVETGDLWQSDPVSELYGYRSR